MSNKKQILFVDDEERVLDGIRRMLRTMRNEWGVSFATSGQQALKLLAEEPYDVIVSDMRMPGMSGAELLEEIRKRYPHMVRIALSGQSSKESVLRSVGPIHQYLPKPCDAETLKATLARTCALRTILQVDKLQELISQLESLPSLPSLYGELMSEINSENASLKSVGNIVSKDISMSAKILQLVNSAFFGIRGHISNPSQAVTILGLDTVKALALSVHVFSQFDHVSVKSFSLKILWEHGMVVGSLAKSIAENQKVERLTIDDAFIAGLLHDVGELVFASILPEEYKEVFAIIGSEQIPISEAERKVIGVTHAEVGAYLLGLWGFSEPVIQALLFHHCPKKSLSKEFTPLTAVHVADVLSYEIQPSHCQVKKEVDEAYLEEVGVLDQIDLWKNSYRETVLVGEEK